MRRSLPPMGSSEMTKKDILVKQVDVEVWASARATAKVLGLTMGEVVSQALPLWPGGQVIPARNNDELIPAAAMPVIPTRRVVPAKPAFRSFARQPGKKF